MADILQPRDAKDVEAAVSWALAEGKALEVAGAGSKRLIGRPSQTDLTLDLSRLRGVTLYEPEELVLSAKAGTPLAEIEALTAANGQELAFEPMDYGPLLGQPGDLGTIGGALATNLSGPRRLKAGAARDHFLGVAAVSGRGETFKSGGRVVKNVTGYDMCKLLAGSWGTLAAMTDVTIKTLPRAETEATLLVRGLAAASAVRAMSAAMGSSCDVSGAAHLPSNLVKRIAVGDIADAPGAITVFRLEGVEPSVRHRLQALQTLMRPSGSLETAGGQASRQLWRAIRNVMAFAANTNGADRPIWRISTAPNNGALVAAIAQERGGDAMLDWAGGLVWLALPPSDDAGAAWLRRTVADFGGHATFIRAPAAIRAVIEVFEPPDPGLGALTKRVKESFDPNGVLNRGRMYAGV